MVGVGRWLRGACAAVHLVATAGVVVAPSPAAAQTPTVVVTPDHVVDGQTVHVEMSDVPQQIIGIVECPASVVDDPPSLAFPPSCRTLSFLFPPFEPERDVQVFSVFSPSLSEGSTVNCHQAPGCVVGIWSPSWRVAVYQPIVFGPDIRPTARQRNLSDGSIVEVVGGGIAGPEGDWTIAQCGRAFLDDPTPAQAAALCTSPTSVEPGAAGAFTADLVVHDPLTSAGEATVPCGYTGCVAVLADAGRPLVSDVAISFGPPLLEVTPATDLSDLDIVQVAVSGAPVDSLALVECRLPLGSNVVTSTCTTRQDMRADQWGSVETDARVVSGIHATGDCHTGTCALVMAMTDTTAAFVGDPVPVTFRPTPTFILDPAAGLLDGQAMSVTAPYLRPGDHRLVHCTDGACNDESVVVTVGSDGLLSTTIPALQRFTATNSAGPRHVYCRAASCHVMFVDDGGNILARVPYEMATSFWRTSPATGLGDGQAVQISGNGLMPSYEGPTIWAFPTGGWALTQCDAAVLDDLSLVGVFTHCAAPPTTRDVTIEGSTLDTMLDVQSTITKILGGTSDCAASAGACVVGLVRLEQDGSLSSHLTPISFGA
jgi:hypothetical protein